MATGDAWGTGSGDASDMTGAPFPEPDFPGPEWREELDRADLPRRRVAKAFYISIVVIFALIFLAPVGAAAWSRLGRLGLGGIRSRSEAEAAIAALKVARVGGSESSRTWLTARDDGTFEASGHFTGNGSGGADFFGTSTVAEFVVEERVDRVALAHSLQLELSADTPAVLNGRSTTYGEAGAEEVGQDMAVVRFRVAGGRLVAEQVRYDGENDHKGWPDDYPFDGIAPGVGVPASAPGGLWLDAPAGRTGSVTGLVVSTMQGEPGVGLAGSADVSVPDALGPAPIVHVARVFWHEGPGVGMDGGESGLRTFPVALADGKVWLAR